MIKVSVFYPNEDGKRFDMDYYLNKHMPMVRDRLGAALKNTAVDAGLGGAMPGTPAPYAAIGHLFFDSVEAFQQAFAPHAPEIVGDVPNYSQVQPVIQVSEVKL